MTSNEIESLPALLESHYCIFRDIIRDALYEALLNGDAVEDMQKLRGDFYRALSHTLDEYNAPAGTIEEITQASNQCGNTAGLARKLADQVLALNDTGELGSGRLAKMKSTARLIA
jgi:hypothetical protein